MGWPGLRKSAIASAMRWRGSSTIARTHTWTPKLPWRERKQRYLERLGDSSSSALRVSLADKLDNARTVVRDYRNQGEDLSLRWGRRAQDVRWYYDALSEHFADLRPGSLAEELRRTVAELDSLPAESGQA